MFLCTAGVSFSQDTSVGVGVNGSASGSTDGASAGADVGVDAGVSVGTDDDDTTGDDDSEDDDDAGTGGGTTGGATGGTGLDSNGDGTISEDEQAAAGNDDDDDDEDSPAGIEDCAVVDFSGTGMMDISDIAAISAATSVTVVRLTDCEGEADLDSDLESAVFGNPTIAAQLAQEGVGGGEVIGISDSEGAITVYVAQDDSETGGGEGAISTDGTATGTSQ